MRAGIVTRIALAAIAKLSLTAATPGAPSPTARAFGHRGGSSGVIGHGGNGGLA